jgi:MinD superfamily P-loop ATPase
MIREIVILSGKGGTGKTSLTASFALLAGNAVVADCDVDAADLHLLLHPRPIRRERFFSGTEAMIRPEACFGCGRCRELCRFGAIREHDGVYSVDPTFCEGCGVCVHLCPAEAIAFPERESGELMVSESRAGRMVHARLHAAAENSGKLVTAVRKEARIQAETIGKDLILVDGPPGIGCPVIASLTGSSLVLAVTEPTPSGEHDLLRLLELTRHFLIPTLVCVNKWDINPGMTGRIEALARKQGAEPMGRIRYDAGFSKAQVRGLSVIETDSPSADDIRSLWKTIQEKEQS